MYEIPLFPLNTVLFPGMSIPLQIFEDRYKEMVQLCIAEQRPFGVVLIKEGVAEQGPLAVPHLMGCTAEILRVQPLDETGRMFIVGVGQERFRIVSLKYDRPYLVGMVENAAIWFADSAVEENLSTQLYPLVVEYLEIMAEAGELQVDTLDMPEEPEQLTYLASAVIQLSADEKQALLNTIDGSDMLKLLLDYYQREVPLMRMMPRADMGIFSFN